MREIKEIAESYHDRIVMASSMYDGQICDCCEDKVYSRSCIEHDSLDYSKDLMVCITCYIKIMNYWQEHKPRKIAPC